MSAEPPMPLQRGKSLPGQLTEFDQLFDKSQPTGGSTQELAAGIGQATADNASKVDDKKPRKVEAPMKPKSLYERVMGKGTVFDNSTATTTARRQSVGSTIGMRNTINIVLIAFHANCVSV